MNLSVEHSVPLSEGDSPSSGERGTGDRGSDPRE